jgi:hypothetical protein
MTNEELPINKFRRIDFDADDDGGGPEKAQGRPSLRIVGACI